MADDVLSAEPRDYTRLDWRLVPHARPLSVSEQIAERISQAILAGEYHPGERLSEQSIADRYEVSRGPVREALRLLEKESVAEIVPRRGAVVSVLSVKEVTDIFDIRAALLGLCARMVAETITAEQLSQMSSWVAALGELSAGDGTADEYLSVTFRLSLYLASICGNERLYEMVRSLSRQTVRYSSLGLAAPARRRRSAKTWRALLRAIRAHDGGAAEAACRALVEESRDAAIARLASLPDVSQAAVGSASGGVTRTASGQPHRGGG